MLKNLPAYLANAKKAIINLTGLLATILSLGLLPEPYKAWVTTAVVILTAIVHYITENAPAPGTAPAESDPDTEELEQPDEWQPGELITASHVAATQKQAAPPST